MDSNHGTKLCYIIRNMETDMLPYDLYSLSINTLIPGVELTLHLAIYAASSELGPRSVAIVGSGSRIIVQFHSEHFPNPSSRLLSQMTGDRLNKIKHRSQLELQ